MKIKDIEPSTILQRNPSQLFSIIDQEVVMLSVKNGEYYSLNEVGSKIWDFLEHPHTYSDLLSKLGLDFEASPELIDIDTKPFLIELILKEIVLIERK